MAFKMATLQQFYEGGPYIHEATNTKVPYYTVFFAGAAEIDQANLQALDAAISRLLAIERAFYADMGVVDANAFNSKYMIKDMYDKTPSASKRDDTFWGKINYLLIVQLRSTLASIYTTKEYNEILKMIFAKKGREGIYERITEMVSKYFNIALDSPKLQQEIGVIILANAIPVGERRKSIPLNSSLDATSYKGLTDGVLRDIKLQINQSDLTQINYSIEKAADLYYTKNKLVPLIQRAGINAKAMVDRELTAIFDDEYGDKNSESKRKKQVVYSKTIYKEIDGWVDLAIASDHFVASSAITGSIGEYSISFLLTLENNKKDPTATGIMKKMAKIRTGKEFGTQFKRKLNIQTGENENVLTKKTFKRAEHSAQITQDIVFKGKSGQSYAFSVKNYLAQFLERGLNEVAIEIRGAKNLSSFLGEVQAAGAGVSFDEMQRFVYVLVNNIFRGQDNQTLLIKFMDNLINFYLQNKIIKSISHIAANSVLNDTRNSFIVLAGVKLIPMSTILIAIRNNLQQMADRNYSGANASSLISPGAINVNQSIDASYLTNQKEEAKQTIPDWVGPNYGPDVLNVGIQAGLLLYNSITMPGIRFNMSQLLSAINI